MGGYPIAFAAAGAAVFTVVGLLALYFGLIAPVFQYSDTANTIAICLILAAAVLAWIWGFNRASANFRATVDLLDRLTRNR